MKKKILICTAAIAVVILAAAVIIANTQGSATLDAEYISKASAQIVPAKEIIHTDTLEGEKGIMCVVALSDGGVGIAYLEPDDNAYTFKGGSSLPLDSLSDADTVTQEYSLANTAYDGKTLYYALYKNPQRDTVTVNGEQISVTKLTLEHNGTETSLGYWSTLAPAAQTPTVE